MRPLFQTKQLLAVRVQRHQLWHDSRDVKVSVWWDFENCQVPAGVDASKVAPAITKAVRASGIKGPLRINAFGDVLLLSKSNQQALSHTGIDFTHIPGFSSILFFNSSPHLTLLASKFISGWFLVIEIKHLVVVGDTLIGIASFMKKKNSSFSHVN